MRVERLLLPVLLLAWTASPARSQVRGFPLYAVPAEAGVTFSGDVAFASEGLCPGTCVGVSVLAAKGPVGLGATVATSGYGALLTVNVVRPVGQPFGLVLQAGASGAMTGGYLQVPFGTGFSVLVPTPIAALQPWIGIRGQYMDPGDGFSGAGEVHAGFSAGLGIVFLNGLGLRAAYDRLLVTGSDLSTFGVGISISFDPGL